MLHRFTESDVVAVSLHAFMVNGGQDGWLTPIQKEEYLDEALNRTILEVNVEADAFANLDYEEEIARMAEERSLDTDDDVAWR